MGASPHTPFFIPDWQDTEICQSRTRSQRPVCQMANALPCCAFPRPCSCGEKCPIAGEANARMFFCPPSAFLSFFLPGKSAKKLSHSPAPSKLRSPLNRMRPAFFLPSHNLFISCKGVWGAAPWLKMVLDLALLRNHTKKQGVRPVFLLKNPAPSECNPAFHSPCGHRAEWRPGCRE